MSIKALLQQRESERLPEPQVRRLLREGVGLTQKELAEELGVRQASICRYESGERNPSGSLAEKYGFLLQELARLQR